MKTHMILATMTAVALAALVPVVPATAAPLTDRVPAASTVVLSSSGSIHVVASGTTSDGGWVAFTGDGNVRVRVTAPTPSGGVSTQSVVEQDGGIWDYGSGYNLIGEKGCHSYYSHDTRAHGSSVSMNGSSDTDYVSAGEVSYAYVQKRTNATCYAHYRF